MHKGICVTKASRIASIEMRLVLLISLLVLVLSMTSVAAAVTTAIRGKVPKLVAFDLDGK